MMDAATWRTGLALPEFAAAVRGLSPGELAARCGRGFFLRQNGAAAVSSDAVAQTLVASRKDEREEVDRGLLDYHVYPVRRVGTSRFGGDYIGVGRGEHNDLVVDDPSVSKFHAFILQEASGFSLSDAGSRNGTFVNDARVVGYRDGKPSPLVDGDRVRLGDVRLTFVNTDTLWRLLQRLGE